VKRSNLLVILLLAAPTPVIAQRSDTLPVGTRVRVTTTRVPDFPVRGTIAGFRNDTVWVDARSGAVKGFALRDLHNLEVSTGERARTLEGLGVGLVGGAVIGAAIGALAGRDEFLGSEVYALLGAGVGAFGGLFIGAAIGSSMRTDRWGPAPGWEPGVGLTIRF
jgi:hypothetical protein